MDAAAKEALNRIFSNAGFDPAVLRQKYEYERDRRIRPEGARQYLEVTAEYSDFGRDPWVDADFQRAPQVGHSAVLIAGGGFGGLLAGARLHEAGIRDVRIIEEAGGFGGTWYWNRYPGAMCDIEAHIYLPLLEEMNYAPRHRYAYSSEIRSYCEQIAERYDLDRKCHFQTVIEKARWLDSEAHWEIRTDRGDRFTADFFIPACGRQSLPKLPRIPGINELEAHTFHSSRWDYGYTHGAQTGALTGLADKSVAVIGTGATAVQIVPEVAKWAKNLCVFQRTPSSMGLRGNRPTGPDWVDRNDPDWQKKRQENFQAIVSGLPVETDLVRDGWTEMLSILNDKREQELQSVLGRPLTTEETASLAEMADFRVMEHLRSRVDQIVRDPLTAEALKPWYRWACKRPCFHDEYLQSFNQENVHLIDTHGQGVQRFTQNGVVAAGKIYPVDCVIFATGFESVTDYTHLTGFEMYGRGGRALSEHWAGGVRTLHGLSTDQFPNLLFMGGNQQTASAVNAVHLLDEQAKHIAYIISTADRSAAVSIEPAPDAVDQYVDLIQTSPKNQALFQFYAACTPGYYNAEGLARKNEDLFMGGRYGDGPLAYYEMLDHWRQTDRLEGMQIDFANLTTE